MEFLLEDGNTSKPVPMEMDNEEFSSLLSGKKPLGFVLMANNCLCPFGILPTEIEASALGDPKTWKEVKVLPPMWLWGLESNKFPQFCPVDSCQEKITKSFPIEAHLKKHLSLIISQPYQKNDKRLDELAKLPPPDVPINFYCDVKNCIYEFSVYEKPRSFSMLKYLKQHYFKVHAPKILKCDSCEKTFSTMTFLEVHKRMCGKSFDCSDCSSKYNTIESLQTHSRRKDHTYDYEKYREIINTSIKEMKARRAEENLKLKAVSDAIKSVPVPRNEVKKLPICIPRPKTVTTCGPGGATSHVTWTYEHGTDNLKVKVEISTQTNSDYESQEGVEINSADASAKVRSFSAGSHQGKRKKSAETQTQGKVRYKISTETQTANVIKRRRASKKQNSEAETQCPIHEPTVTPLKYTSIEKMEPGEVYIAISTNAVNTFTNSLSQDTTHNSEDMLTSESSSCQPPLFSLAGLLSIIGIDDSSNSEEPAVPEYLNPEITEYTDNYSSTMNLEAMLNRVNNTSTVGESGVSTSEMCVGNRFDEVAQQLFDFEEFNRETQTDPKLFHPSDDYILTDIDMEVGGDNDPISSLLNLVTTETQTWHGVSPPRGGGTESTVACTSSSNIQAIEISQNDPESEWNFIQQQTKQLCQPETESSFDIPVLSPKERNANSPTFLETMDNETQTYSLDQGYDFEALLNNMMSPHH